MPSRVASTPSPLTLEIAATLRAERARRRLTAEDLAQATGISRSQVNKILAGAKPISLDELDRLCYSLNLSMVQVLVEADRVAGDRSGTFGELACG